MDELARLAGVSAVLGGVRVLDDVALRVGRGEVVAIVGESGSGKTTLCRVLMGLVPAEAGEVVFAGRGVGEWLRADALGFRRRAQMLLQDAAASLSPRMRVGALLGEALAIHGLPGGAERVSVALRGMGLPREIAGRFPHELSGGQARRVATARALLLEPELLVADEPTAGLDVSVQGELLNLLLRLRAERGMATLMVSHGLDVVRRAADRCVVMYLGQVMEEAGTAALFAAPAHPYAAALLSTNPVLDPARRRPPIVLEGEIPSVAAPPAGCRFHTRCPVAQRRCSAEMPELREMGGGRAVRCHFPFSLSWGGQESVARQQLEV